MNIKMSVLTEQHMFEVHTDNNKLAIAIVKFICFFPVFKCPDIHC